MKRETFEVETRKDKYFPASDKHEIMINSNGFQPFVISNLSIEELYEIEKSIRSYRKKLKDEIRLG